MKILAITTFNLRRLFRVRSNLFFIIILPLLLILLLGSAFGGAFTPKVGIYDAADDPLSRELVAALEANDEIDIRIYDDEDAMVGDISRGTISSGVSIPDNYAARAQSGESVTVQYFGRLDSIVAQLSANVNAAITRQNLILRAALFTQQETGISLEQAIVRTEQTLPQLPGADVTVERVGDDIVPEGKVFDTTASASLLLFIFITSLTSSVALIETRRLGVARRMLSTPTSAITIVVGETTGRYAIALLQGLIIMGGSSLLFGVTWGDIPSAIALMLVFSLVGTGAGMLLGSLFSNDSQAGAVALLLGLGMAALGGSMVPLEIFPETMRDIAHITPHAWGNDAFSEIIVHNGGIGDILNELGVLAAYAAGLLAVSAWFLRRRIISP